MPCTREATVVHAIDNLGGKLGSFDRLEKGLQEGETWSRFDRALSGSAYFGRSAHDATPLPEPVQAALPAAVGRVAARAQAQPGARRWRREESLRSPGHVDRQGPQARNTRGGPAGRGLRAPRRDLVPQAGPRGAVARLADRRDPGLCRHRGPDRDAAAARVPRPDQRAGAAHQRPCRRRLDREPRRPDRLDPGPGRRAGMQHRGRRAGHRLRAGPQRPPVLDRRRRPRRAPGADRPAARHRRGHRGPGVPLRRAGDRHRLPRLPRELRARRDADPRRRLRPDPLPGRGPRRAHRSARSTPPAASAATSSTRCGGSPTWARWRSSRPRCASTSSWPSAPASRRSPRRSTCATTTRGTTPRT